MSEERSLFLKKFSQVFEQYSYGNVYYGKLCAHVLLGQVLKYNRIFFGPNYIDPRVSIFIVQSSGTGKSVAYPLVYGVAKAAQIDIGEIDEITDAGLIGTIEEETYIDPETGTKLTRYNKIIGKLAEAGILHYDEGKMLIERGPYAANTLTWLQKALNPIGSEQNICSKKLAHGELIEIHPTCSLIITSHPFSQLLQPVLDTGFFQRIILYPRDIPISERRSLEFMRAEKLGKRLITEPDIKLLGEALIKIRSTYEGKQIEFEEDVIPVARSKIQSFYNLIAPAHNEVREIMATFIPRYNNLMYILAYHHCCDRLGAKVEIEDLNYAFGTAFVLFRELMSWIEQTANFYKMGNKDLTYLRLARDLFTRMQKQTEEGFVMKLDLMKRCAEEWRVSLHTVEKYFEKFKGYGKLKEFERDKINYVKIEV
jgi:hypothetical protein